MVDPFLTLSQTMPGMPPASWWVAPVVLILLGTLAVIDMLMAKVPDPLVLPSLLLIALAQGYYVDWTFAGRSMLIAFGAAFALYLINEIWFRVTKRDGFGMGDAKWTMLAVACFSVPPAAIAWATGAWFALGWMGVMKLAKRPMQRVHFVPFLFIGLLAGIWWMKMRN